MTNMNGNTWMRIGQLAAELGLNPKTIRYYEQIGLLPMPARTGAGYRVYVREDLERLRFIGKAKTVGMTLDEIREVLRLFDEGEQPCAHVLGLLDHKVAAVDKQLRALEAFRDELVALQDRATRQVYLTGRVCGIIESYECLPPAAVTNAIAKGSRLLQQHSSS